MPLLLSQADLRPLVTDPAGLDAMLQATEETLLAAHRGVPSEVCFTGLALAGANVMQTFLTATPGRQATVRVFPAPGNAGPTRDAWIGLLLDPDSGALVAAMAGDDLNPLRTAVPAALGARHLAPDGARTLAILGSGRQARAHARTFAHALPKLERVHVWSPTPAHRRGFAEEMTAVLGIAVTAVDHPAEALAEADVIAATGATHGQPAAEAGWVRPGALFVSLVGSAPRDLPGRLFVPTLNPPRVIAFAFTPRLPLSTPRFDPEHTQELARVVAGEVPAREVPEQTVVYELAGPYLWDPAIFSVAHQWAVAHGVGTVFEFSVPAP
jgi:alanine dehydrogenase